MNFIILLLFGISLFPSFILSQRASSNAQQICRNNRNAGMFAHEEYCDYYYECDGNGEVIVQSCPNGLAFSGARRGLVSNCDYPHRVGCPDGQRTMGQSPISSENCHWQYGLFPHATSCFLEKILFPRSSCTRFWHCWNGTSVIQQCPFSLLYNDNLSICDYPQNVKDCMAHPICKDTPNGPVPIEKSCVRYWLCIGGYPRLQRCPAGLAINSNTLKCEAANTVQGCEPPPTSNQPGSAGEEEEEGGEPSSGSSQPSDNNSNNRPSSSSSSNSRPSSSGSNSNSNSNSNTFRSSSQGVRLVG